MCQVNSRSKTKSFLEALRAFLFFDPLIYLYTVVMGSLSLLSSFFDRDGSIQHWFARTWSWMILKTIFSPVTVVGRENIPSGPAVYAANHQSAMDIPVLYTNLPTQFRIVAKIELFRYPFMGWHLSRSGQIPVDEKNVRANLKTLQRGVETLKHGMPLVVFPEGGRTRNGSMTPFKHGLGMLVAETNVPVVPCGLIGTFEALPPNRKVPRPVRIKLIIGEPLNFAGTSNNHEGWSQIAQGLESKVRDLATR